MVLDHAVSIGFSVRGLTFSPVKGPEGNIEYLLYLSLNADAGTDENINASAVVEEAHRALDR